MKKIFEAEYVPEEQDIDVEDGGCAKILTIDGSTPEEDGLFVRIQSWVDSEDPVHEIFDQMIGKKVKVTVEVEE